MANRQINPDTYNVGFDDAEQGNPYRPPFTDKADIEQYRAGYENGYRPDCYDEQHAERVALGMTALD